MMLTNKRAITGGISTLIILIGLALAFVFGGFNLPIFFVALAFAILIGSLGSSDPNNVYGGIHGFFWMLILALFFITGSWIWFLVGAGISVLLTILMRPILGALVGVRILGITPVTSAPQHYYEPPQQ